jgi:prephenate dehydratase
MFRLPHSPGTLAEALDVFKQNKIKLNVDRIIPIADGEIRISVFRGLRGTPRRTQSGACDQHSRNAAAELTVLGAFPVAQTVGG